MAIATGLTIYVNGYNLACAFKTFEPTAEVEVIDTTTLCRTARTYTQGFKTGNVSVSGVWDYDQTNADEIHNVLGSAFSNGTECIVTASTGTLAVGIPAVMLNADETSFSVDVPLGQLVMCNADFQAKNGVNFGKFIFSSAVASTTTNGTSQDNTTASTNGGLFHVHYQNTSASSASCKFQHSTDNSTWVDLATKTLTGNYDADSYEVAAGTTINRYVRATATTAGGTATFQIAFARR